MACAPMYGTFSVPLPVAGHSYLMPRPPQHQQQAVVYTNDYSRTPKIIARETPLQLPDGVSFAILHVFILLFTC